MNSLFDGLLIYDRIYCLINDRHKNIEQLIATDAVYSYHYAVDVIGGRFEFGEKMITRDEYINRMYRDFLETL